MSRPEPGGHHEECYACPIGSLFLTVQTAQPEAQEHLLNAVSELLLVARALIDAAEVAVEHQRRAAPAREPRIRRIDID